MVEWFVEHVAVVIGVVELNVEASDAVEWSLLTMLYSAVY